jgi:lambda repressor-like predicted transcriptional regulator
MSKTSKSPFRQLCEAARRRGRKRTDRPLSMVQLAKRAGVPVFTLYKACNGTAKFDRTEYLVAGIALAFGVREAEVWRAIEGTFGRSWKHGGTVLEKV